LSVFTLASAIARSLRGVRDRDAADVGLDEALYLKRRPRRLERHLVCGRQAFGE
jgi:hypothetical protein